jgi:hypothetical protein
MFDTAKKIKNFVLISILVLYSSIICYQNYNSGTYLSGWDTLHSEFDFGIAISRAFSPAFQEHQGLGAVSSQSHIGDLPRIIFLYILSFIFSENFLRYSYVFLMLIVGPLGVYFFIKELLSKDQSEEEEDESMLIPSFIGALFYLTNLSVVQHFSVPLEMFLTLFGFIGFIFLVVTKLIKEFNQKNVFNLVLISFLISPSGHTATLFYMFLLVLGVYILVNFLISEDRKTVFKNSIIAFLLVMGTNLFWILPNVYFILTRGVEVSNSKIHSLFSDQAYLSNLSFGNLSDISLLKNYLFIWQIWNGEKFVPLLGSWIENLDSGLILFGYLVFILAVFGIGLTVVKKEKKLYSFLIIFFLSSIFISSSNSFAGGVIDFLRENVPFLKEALRFPFNKFSTIFAFSIAIFLAYFNYILLSYVKREALKISTAVFFLILSTIYFLPAFNGDLISPKMRITFKNEYFELFDYFKTQTEYGRIADLPIHSVYGWSYYNFGYQGAGFLWFGLDKPLLNREFDRWNVKNEDYFNEMSFAIYNNNSKDIENVLNKYHIRWILLDKNVFAPNESSEILNFENIESSLARIPNLKLDKKVGENIYIYKYFPSDDFARSQIIPASYISNEFYRESKDLVFEKLGNYYSDLSSETSFGIKTSTEILNTKNISSDDEKFYIKNIKTLRDIQNTSNLTFKKGILDVRTTEKTFSLDIPTQISTISVDNEVLEINDSKKLQLGVGSEIKIFETKENLNLIDIDPYVSVRECGIVSFGSRYSLEKSSDRYKLVSNNINSCLVLSLKELLENKSFENYLLNFRVSNLNSNTYFCVEDSKGGCVKEKILNNAKFILTKKDNTILLFNEPNSNLEGSTTFFDFNIKTMIENKNTKLKIDSSYFNKTEELIIEKDKNLSGNLSKFGFNPRICQTSDLISSRVGLYESSTFNICDNYNIDYEPNNFHLVEIKSKNNSGLPLRICLQNSRTLRCDVFMALPKNPEFKSDFLLLPSFQDPHNLAITNQVIEGSTSSNEISYISVKKIDYFRIFNLQNEKTSVIYTYNKSFDKGFVPFCGFSICPFKHVLVNNWANGWVIPENYDLQNNDILIVFWPNYLSLIGFIVFLLFLRFIFNYVILNNKPIVDKKAFIAYNKNSN